VSEFQLATINAAVVISLFVNHRTKNNCTFGKSVNFLHCKNETVNFLDVLTVISFCGMTWMTNHNKAVGHGWSVGPGVSQSHYACRPYYVAAR